MEFTDRTSPSVLKHNPQPRWRSILIVLVYLISFLLLDIITKQFESLPGIVTWYPPAGLTYALLLVFGVRFTPAVILALFLSSVFIYRMPQTPFLLFLWSLVNSMIYAAATWFLRHRIHLDWQLRKLRDVAWLIGVSVLVSAFLAVLSVSSSALSIAIPRNETFRAIFHWWIGESVGVLTVTPFLLMYVMPWLKRFVDGLPVRVPKHFSFPSSALTYIGQAFSLVLVIYWVFGVHVLNEYKPIYLITLPLIWIALDHGLKKLTLTILILNIGEVLSIWLFGFDLARLGELELLMIVICIIGLLMGAVVTEREVAVQTSLANEEKFRMLVEEVNDGFYISDAEGIFTFANSTLARIYGVENPQALLGHKFFEFVSPDMPAGLNDVYSKAMQDGRSPDVIEGQIMQPNGSRTFVEIKPVMIQKAGQIVGTRGVVRDITERKKTEESLRKSEKEFHILAEAMPQIVWITRPDGWNIYFNQQWVDYTGLTLEESYGHGWNKPFHPDDQQRAWDAWQNATKEGTVYSLDCRLRRADGAYKWWLVRGVPVLDAEGTILKWFGTCTDIEELKQTENEIKTQLDELQRWQVATLGRENRILELKHEVNELLAETKKLPRYPSAEFQDEQEQ